MSIVFLRFFYIFLLFFKHFFNIFACENMFFVAESAIHLKMLLFSLGNLLPKHLLKYGLSSRNKCALHSIARAIAKIIAIKLVKEIKFDSLKRIIRYFNV